MLHWDNSFAPDRFSITRLEDDEVFLNPLAGKATVLGSTLKPEERAIMGKIPPASEGNMQAGTLPPSHIPAGDESQTLQTARGGMA